MRSIGGPMHVYCMCHCEFFFPFILEMHTHHHHHPQNRYELLTGNSPYGKQGDSRYEVWTKIAKGKKPKPLPKECSSKICDMLDRMFEKNWKDRLKDSIAIQSHEWFGSSLDWASVSRCRITPPIKPNTNTVKDTFHFDKFEKEDEDTKDEKMAVLKSRSKFLDF